MFQKNFVTLLHCFKPLNCNIPFISQTQSYEEEHHLSLQQINTDTVPRKQVEVARSTTTFITQRKSTCFCLFLVQFLHIFLCFSFFQAMLAWLPATFIIVTWAIIVSWPLRLLGMHVRQRGGWCQIFRWVNLATRRNDLLLPVHQRSTNSKKRGGGGEEKSCQESNFIMRTRSLHPPSFLQPQGHPASSTLFLQCRSRLLLVGS